MFNQGEKFDLSAYEAAQNKRRREARASSSLKKSKSTDMTTKPYYQCFAYLDFEEEDLQQPESFHATLLDAAQAVNDFIMGSYGYGDYYMDTPGWFPCDWVTSFEDGNMEIIDVPGIAEKISDALEEEGKFKLEWTDQGKSYFEVTRVDE